VFFVEAHYHHSPRRAADQVRYIAHREEGLRDGQRHELYGIGPRYRAFRGDERAIRKALVEDARGLRNPVHFRFILTVDNRTAARFARLDGRLAERVLRDSVQQDLPRRCPLPSRFSRIDQRRYTCPMTTTAEEVLKEALQLSEGERARVAAELLASLEPDVETRDGEAWIAEVERRAQAAISGLPGLGWDETRTRIEERVSRTRK
jgi:hypothetical protein